MGYGFAITMSAPFEETVVAVRQALSEQGFGVLTEIDVQATMKAKLDVDGDPYLILGACNPPLAHRAMSADPSIGLLLPCNVVVRTADEGTVVEVIDPMTMVSMSLAPELRAVAEEATARLRAALSTLAPDTEVV